MEYYNYQAPCFLAPLRIIVSAITPASTAALMGSNILFHINWIGYSTQQIDKNSTSRYQSRYAHQANVLKANNTTAPTTTICATVAPNMTSIRRSIFLSTKASANIATTTKNAIRTAPNKEISDTIIYLIN